MNVSNYVGLVSSWSRRSRTIVSSHLRGSQFSSRGYFLSEKFFSWVFCESNNFSHGYFVGPKKSIEVHWNELHEVHRSTIFLLYLRRIWRQSVRRDFLAKVRLIHALFIEFHHFMKKIDTAKDWSSQAKHF